MILPDLRMCFHISSTLPAIDPMSRSMPRRNSDPHLAGNALCGLRAQGSSEFIGILPQCVRYDNRMIDNLVGGLEHEFYFSIYWELHNPN
jgi:hypothetical protein